MMESIDAKDVARRYVAAVEAGDEQAIREVFAEDAVWTLQAGDLPISGSWKGRESIMGEFLATAMSHYEPSSVRLEITSMIAERDQVVLQWTSRARTRDGRPALRERYRQVPPTSAFPIAVRCAMLAEPLGPTVSESVG